MESVPKKELIIHYDDELVLIQIFQHIRWANGIYCPHCHSKDIYRRGKQGMLYRYSCNKCKSIFNDFTGTKLARKKISLFQILYIIVNSDKKSINSIANDLDLKWETVNSVTENFQKDPVILE